MTYKPYNENLTTPTQQNPHSPAAGVKQQPVDIPGVISQTTNLYKPYVAPENKDNK